MNRLERFMVASKIVHGIPQEQRETMLKLIVVMKQIKLEGTIALVVCELESRDPREEVWYEVAKDLYTETNEQGFPCLSEENLEVSIKILLPFIGSVVANNLRSLLESLDVPES